MIRRYDGYGDENVEKAIGFISKTAPWVRKFGRKSIRENLVMTYRTNDRTYTHYM